MTTEKAAYWLALVALAIALRGEYRKGGFPALHRAVHVTGSELCELATKAERNLAVARLFANSGEQRLLPETDAALALRQAEIDRMVALHQAEIERAMALRQVDIARIRERVDTTPMVMDRTQSEKLHRLDSLPLNLNDAANRQVVLVCPKTGFRMAIGADTDMSVLGVDTDAQ